MVKITNVRVPNLTEENKAVARDLRAITRPGSRLYGFARGDSPQEFQDFERPVLRGFEEQVLPGISQQYAGSGLLSSSAYANAIAGANTRLQENLVAQRHQVRSQAFNQLLQADQLLFANPEYRYRQVITKKPSFFQRLLGIGSSLLLGGLAGGAVGLIGGALGGIAGGAAGGLKAGLASGLATGGAAGIAANTLQQASPFISDVGGGGSQQAQMTPIQPVAQGQPQLPLAIKGLAEIASGTTPVNTGQQQLAENDPIAIEQRKARSGRGRGIRAGGDSLRTAQAVA